MKCLHEERNLREKLREMDGEELWSKAAHY